MSQTAVKPFYPVTIQNLSIYRIRAFDRFSNLNYAIFTRHGGVSQKPFQSLNLSVSVGDEPEAVSENTSIACHSVGISPEQTVSSHLVHGADIVTVTSANRRQVMAQADGLITSETGIFLFMRFADCTPLIFFDPVQQAVGLTHAGWRGTMQNAAGATVAAMAQRLDSWPANIMAVIGPAIGPCCYEVGPEVIGPAEKFLPAAGSLFRPNGRPDHAQFDMWEANRRQLAEAGVTQIIQSGICTACHTGDFFSHRAEHGRTGRFGVIIGLQGAGA